MKHKHWPHMVLCIVLCLVLHFAFEWWETDDTSVYIADLQAQVDILRNRLDDVQGISYEDWDR